MRRPPPSSSGPPSSVGISVRSNRTLNTARISALLRQSPLFRDLADEDMEGLHDEALSCQAAEGELLFREGDPGDKLYLLVEGRVRIFRRDPHNNEIELARIGPGAFFGDMALIDGQPRSAYAAAETWCSLYTIGRKEMMKRLMQSERMLSALLSGMSERLRATSQQVYDAALRQQLLATQAELDRHLSASQMVARVAHEVNTPIGIANQAASLITQLVGGRTAADLAKDDEARDTLTDVLEACQLIGGNLQRAAALIGSFKRFSARQAHVAVETVDPGDVLREVVRLYRVNPRKSRLDIQVEDALPPDHRQWRGYPGYLSQVLLNLLSNADRYAYPNGPGTIHIRVSACAYGELPGFQIVVKDLGQGMPPESLRKLFDAFFTTGRDEGGTGLGMSIVKHLVSGPMKGRIEVESAEGAGTTFTLWFPARIDEGIGE